MKRGKSLPLARVSGRKFRFECRRDAKRGKNRGKRIDISVPIPRKKSSKRKILFKASFLSLSLVCVFVRQGQSPKD